MGTRPSALRRGSEHFYPALRSMWLLEWPPPTRVVLPLYLHNYGHASEGGIRAFLEGGGVCGVGGYGAAVGLISRFPLQIANLERGGKCDF